MLRTTVRQGLAALLLLPLTGLALVFAGCAASTAPTVAASRPAEAPAWRYALMIDASSSASTLQIYQWQPGAQGRLPRIEPAPVERSPGEPDWEAKVKPGLGAYGGHPDAAASSLEPLLDYALGKIGSDPATLSQASVTLRATAGMRLLPEDDRQKILTTVREMLASVPFGSTSARVISGAEEGVYGWIAVNYLLGHLEHGGPFPTVGALDLGGASTQITFQPLDHPQTNGQVIALGANSYHLYTKSYLGFGQDRARQAVASPACFLVGYPLPSGSVGTGDFDSCRSDIRSKLGAPCSDGSDDSETEKPCSPFDDDQPPLYGDFVALSVYAYAADFFDLGERLTPSELATAGSSFCAIDWPAWVEREPGIAEDPYVPLYCFSAAYIVTLLEDGFGFAASTERITAPRRVQGAAVGWTLGSLLWELAGTGD